jgi:branched-chain amino acid transport system permease protein
VSSVAELTTAPPAGAGPRRSFACRRRRPGAPTLLRILALLIVAIFPIYLPSSLLQVGLFCMSAIIGAIGLNLLTGNTGQLSLAHAFFLAVGGYGYAYFSGKPSKVGGGISASGLELPTIVAAILAVLLAGFLGLLFSPISSRLRGIYLGIASLALVFIGQHILFNAETITGGFNGRNIPTFNLFGFGFDTTDPSLYILNVEFGRFERLWYLGLVLVVLSYIFAKNLLRGRPGWAMQMVRDSEIAAAVMGVDVRRYKASAFVLSSMYAGLAGVLFALTFSRIVPDTFGFDLSIQFLAMIIIGGLGSVGGAALGAIFVIALPQLLTLYGSDLPFLAAPGSGGVDPGTFAKYVFGAAIIGFLIFEAGGLAAIGRRLAASLSRRAQRRTAKRAAYDDRAPDESATKHAGGRPGPPAGTRTDRTTDLHPPGSPSNST